MPMFRPTGHREVSTLDEGHRDDPVLYEDFVRVLDPL